MKRFLLWFRATFISGLLAILPVGATVYIIWFLYRLVDGLVGKNTPFGMTIERALGRWIPGLGFYVTIIIIILIGVITRNVFGRTLHYYFERIFLAVPGIRKMYGTLKEFTNAVLNRQSSTAFKQVVMFEYPRPGINVIGLVTNEELGKLQDLTGEECVLVYTPTAPNPLSGYMLIIPKRMITPVDISVEDALSMAISSGSVLPDSLRNIEREEGGKRIHFGPFRRR